MAFQSSPSVSDLPFLRFNDYIVEEGITPIADHRKRARTERANGREAYSRRAKAIVQIGPVTNADVSRVTRPVGLSLEIIPERHPALLKPGQRLPIQVRFNRQPLSGALVKLTDLNADAKPRATARTDAQGRVSFTIPQAGKWQFNVIWSEPIPGSQTADYRTTFSSLTFGE